MSECKKEIEFRKWVEKNPQFNGSDSFTAAQSAWDSAWDLGVIECLTEPETP